VRFVLRFLVLALSRPLVTVRLAHPRRIKNALITAITRPQDLAHLYQRYKDIYFPSRRAPSPSISPKVAPLGDIVIFPVIDWNFRFQRPQHLSLQLARQGFRVFYLSATPLFADKASLYSVQESPEDSLFVIQLSSGASRTFDLHRDRLSDVEINGYLMALRALEQEFDLHNPVVVLHHPFWFPVAKAFGGHKIGYDCLDHHAGFLNNSDGGLCDYEQELVCSSDFVTASSSALYKRVSALRGCHLVRNGCEFQAFSRLNPPAPHQRKVAGYVGAIASWFDMELLVAVANRLPEWEFVLVGGTLGCDVSIAKRSRNIRLVGEVPYSQVPGFIETFNVCLIPFRINSLTQATNPVKVYEYLASGRPVVSSRLPELEELNIAGVFLADGVDEFAGHVVQAFETAKSLDQVVGWRAWAAEQSWESRAATYAHIIAEEVAADT